MGKLCITKLKLRSKTSGVHVFTGYYLRFDDLLYLKYYLVNTMLMLI